MTEHKNTLIEQLFTKNGHIFDGFLFEIADPITQYLQSPSKSPEKLEAALKTTCHSNVWFVSLCSMSRNETINKSQQLLFNRTQQLLRAISYISEMIDISQYELDEALTQSCQELTDYINLLNQIVDTKSLNQQILYANIEESFKIEYIAAQEYTLNNSITLAAAEKSLLCWQDAISDIILQKALLHLRYSILFTEKTRISRHFC